MAKRDMSVPRGVEIAKNQIPVRFETVHGEGKWRGVLNFEHGTLCRAFGLDPVRFYFDLPSSARGVGSLSSGNRRNLTINGYVMMHGMTEPYGKLTVCWESERFKDVDPEDKREFYKLS